MFAEGDPFGTTPVTFETLFSGFQSDTHLNPRLGEGAAAQIEDGFLPSKGVEWGCRTWGCGAGERAHGLLSISQQQ